MNGNITEVVLSAGCVCILLPEGESICWGCVSREALQGLSLFMSAVLTRLSHTVFRLIHLFPVVKVLLMGADPADFHHAVGASVYFLGELGSIHTGAAIVSFAGPCPQHCWYVVDMLLGWGCL